VEGPGRKRSTDNSTNSCISRFTLCNNYVVCPAEDVRGEGWPQRTGRWYHLFQHSVAQLGILASRIACIDICIAFFVGWMWFVRLIWGGDRIDRTRRKLYKRPFGYVGLSLSRSQSPLIFHHVSYLSAAQHISTPQTQAVKNSTNSAAGILRKHVEHRELRYAEHLSKHGLLYNSCPNASEPVRKGP
jgi:hypothetical protein